MKLHLVVILLLFCLSSVLFAETNKVEYSYGNPISNIVSDGQFLYYTSNLGFVKYLISDGTKTILPVTIEHPDQITLIEVDLYGRVWYASRNTSDVIELHCIEGNVVSVYTSGIVGPSLYYMRMMKDNQEKIWLSVDSQGLLCFDTITLQWTTFNQTNTSLPIIGITSIYQDRYDNSIWFGTLDNSLLHFQNNTWSVIYDNNSIILGINSFAQTAENGLWIGTSNGLLKYENDFFTQIGEFNKVESILALNTDYLLVDSYDNNLKLMNSITLEQEDVPISYVKQMVNVGGNIYVENHEYLYWLDNSSIIDNFEILFPGNYRYPGYFYNVQVNPIDNSMWVHNRNGLASLRHNGEWTYYTSQNTGIDLSNMQYYYFNNNNELWTLIKQTGNYHFLKFNGQDWTVFGGNEQLETNQVNIIGFDHNNRLWLTSNGKLAYWENNQINEITPNGDPYYTSNSKFIIDEDNNIWFYGLMDLYMYNPTNNELTIMQHGYLFSGLAVYNSNFYVYCLSGVLYLNDHGTITSYNLPDEYSHCQYRIDNNLKVWILDLNNLMKIENNQLVTVLNNMDIWQGLIGSGFEIDDNGNKYIIDLDKLLIFNENLVSTDDQIVLSPTKLNLRNYPNPFNPITKIAFNIKETDQVQIKIYNIKGQLVKDYGRMAYQAGNNSIVWNGKDQNEQSITSGIYFVKVSTSNMSETHKMLLLK